MSERSEHCDTDVSLNKLKQLREAFEAAKPGGRVVTDNETVAALLEALEGAEDALTCVIEDMDGLAIPAEVDDALAKIAALKGES